MDKHTVYNTVSSAVGVTLAIVFFLILVGKIDVLRMLEDGGMGDAVTIFDTRHLSDDDATARVTEFLKNSAEALDSKLEDAAAKLNVDVIDKESLFVYSSLSHNNGYCVRLGVIDSDTTEQAGKIFLFVDEDGIIEVENGC